MKTMQNSTYSMLAEEALASMLPMLDSINSSHPFAISLAKWNLHYDANSLDPVRFDKWFTAFHEMLWDEIYTQQDKVALPSPDLWVTVNMIEEVTDSKFYDIEATPVIETLSNLINLSFVRLERLYLC